MDRSKWRKLIKDDQDGCEWVSFSSGTVKRLCVCVFVTWQKIRRTSRRVIN